MGALIRSMPGLDDVEARRTSGPRRRQARRYQSRGGGTRHINPIRVVLEYREAIFDQDREEFIIAGVEEVTRTSQSLTPWNARWTAKSC